MGWDEPVPTDAPGPAVAADPFASQLFATYGAAKHEFDQNDIDDITMFMEMVAQRKRKKRGEE